MTLANLSLSANNTMAKKGKTFHRAARLLPPSVRVDVVHLYVFCRQVDDLADEPGAPMWHRREALGALVSAFKEANTAELWAAGWTFPPQGAMAEAARLLVLAAANDLEQEQPESEEDLLAYAFGVAGTVGLMMTHVLGARSAGMRPAIALGMAMQLSNIARDVMEDFQNGRVYLPSDWVTRSAVDMALRSAEPAGVRSVLTATSRLLALAETLYEAAFDGIASLPWRIRWSILAAALCYREIGREVGRVGSRSWTQRVVISGRRKLWLITLAGVQLLRPRFWRSRRSAAAPLLGHVARSTIRDLGWPDVA